MTVGGGVAAGRAFVELDIKDLTQKGLRSVQRRLNRFSARMASFSRRMAVVGGAIGLPLMAAARAFAEFEKQMAEVSTMLDKPEMHMRRFSATIQLMSTKYGESSATLAKGLYQILSATIDASQALQVLESSSRAAVAGLTDTTTAADLITTVLNSYNMRASDATRVSDILFATIKRGKTTFGELAQFLGKLTAVSAEVGVKFEEVTATIALLTRNGVQTEVAVTAIRQALASLLKPAKQSADEFERIFGMAMSPEAVQKMGGLPGFLQKLSERSGKEIAKMFPNVRALMGVLPAATNNKELQQDVKAMNDSVGATDEAYDKMSKTLSFQINRLKKSFIVFLQAIGEQLIPELQDGIESFNGMAASIVAFIKTQKPLIMLVAKVTLAMLAFSAGAFVVSKVVGILSIALGTMFVLLKGILFTFGLLIAFPKIAAISFGVLLASIVSARKGLADFQDYSIDVWTSMKNNAAKATRGVISALKAGNLDLAMEILIAGLEILWEDFWFFLKDGFTTLFDGVIKQVKDVGIKLAQWLNELDNLKIKVFGEEPPNMSPDPNSGKWRAWMTHFQEQNTERYQEMHENAVGAADSFFGTVEQGLSGLSKGEFIQSHLNKQMWDEYKRGYNQKLRPLRDQQFAAMNDSLDTLFGANQSPESRRMDAARRRRLHNAKIADLGRKLDERIAQAKREELQAKERYTKAQNDIAEEMEAERQAMTMGEPEIPEMTGLTGENRRAGILRGPTGAFNAIAAVRVAMSSMLPPVVAVDERNANANERSADILQKIDRKLAGVGLAE